MDVVNNNFQATKENNKILRTKKSASPINYQSIEHKIPK